MRCRGEGAQLRLALTGRESFFGEDSLILGIKNKPRPNRRSCILKQTTLAVAGFGRNRESAWGEAARYEVRIRIRVVGGVEWFVWHGGVVS